MTSGMPDGDLAALRDLVLSNTAREVQPISRLGYFCAPFRPRTGPFSDQVIKIYRSPGDAAALATLMDRHDAYVQALVAAGVPLPPTQSYAIAAPRGAIPVIVQSALPSDSLMRPLMAKADLQTTLAMLQGAGDVIARFWHAVRTSDARIGFHPSIRNFAWIDNGAVFFDTFPPLIGYSRDEMGRMLLTYSEKRLMRLIGPLMRRTVTAIQDEWYSAPETLVGLVGSACRLRPEHAEVYLDWGRAFARSEMTPWADAACAGLASPPRLPGYWTGVRRLLGLEGAPNL